jgi:hypothetical protein
MCIAVPTALAVGSIITSAVATGTQIKAQLDAASAAEATAEANEELAMAEAATTLSDARLELYKHAVEARHTTGTKEAIAAAANLDLNFGSAKSLLAPRFADTARDSVIIMTNAARRSHALANQASVYQSQGRNYRSGGTAAAVGSGLAGTTNVLTFATQARHAGVL